MKKSKPFEARNKYLAFKMSIKDKAIITGKRNRKDAPKSENQSKQ